ncbi:MAG: GGDEF domain-containing protein [Candidatus Gracilibacteria bacterium]
MNNTPLLKESSNTHSILNLNQKKLIKLARISTINEIILLSEGKEIEENGTILNEDTKKAAIFIIESIKNILELDPEKIKEYKINSVLNKLGKKLKEKGDCESCAIRLFIQNISLQTSNTLLRLERKQKNKASLTDHLTALVNRAGIDNEIEKQIELKNRDNTNFSILLMDIDDFKPINDTYGHQIGDDVLQKLATILKNNFRKNDTVGRWGGEEFMIILPSTNFQYAAKKANEIRRLIKDTLSSGIDKIRGKITVSIGVTQIEMKNGNIQKLIRNADIALYKSKKEGKNQVQIQLKDTGDTCISACNICPEREKCTKKDKTT